jgi:hypothetical protein
MMATSTTRKADQTRAANRLPKVGGSDAIGVTEHDIARLAYERYQARGGAHGHDLDDWVQAELELVGAVSAVERSR